MALQLLATILSIVIICPKFFGQDISYLRKVYVHVISGVIITRNNQLVEPFMTTCTDSRPPGGWPICVCMCSSSKCTLYGFLFCPSTQGTSVSSPQVQCHRSTHTNVYLRLVCAGSIGFSLLPFPSPLPPTHAALSLSQPKSLGYCLYNYDSSLSLSLSLFMSTCMNTCTCKLQANGLLLVFDGKVMGQCNTEDR